MGIYSFFLFSLLTFSTSNSSEQTNSNAAAKVISMDHGSPMEVNNHDPGDDVPPDPNLKK